MTRLRLMGDTGRSALLDNDAENELNDDAKNEDEHTQPVSPMADTVMSPSYGLSGSFFPPAVVPHSAPDAATKRVMGYSKGGVIVKDHSKAESNTGIARRQIPVLLMHHFQIHAAWPGDNLAGV